MDALWVWTDVKLIRVIDGDSLVCEMWKDIGFRGKVTFQQKLRLNRINAYPMNTDQGVAAAEFVRQELSGKLFGMQTIKPYKYGDQWMAEIVYSELSDSLVTTTHNLSDRLVEAGYAFFWDGAGPRPGG